MARKQSKPEFTRKGVGIETAEAARELSDDMKLSVRRKNKHHAARHAIGANGGGWRRFFRVGVWLRFILTFGSFGLVVHGLFIFFGIYERNQRIAPADHIILLIKLVVFMALMSLFHAMLMHYGPIRHRMRGIFFLALAPVAAVCVFMIYGGGTVFASFIPVLQFLTLVVGVAGFLLYILGYTWLAGRKVRREAARNGDPIRARDKAASPRGANGLLPGVNRDRRKAPQPGNLGLRRTDGAADGPGNGRGSRRGSGSGSGKVQLPEI